MQTFDDMPRRLYFGVSVLLDVNRLVRLLGLWLFNTLNINLVSSSYAARTWARARSGIAIDGTALGML